MVLKIDWKVPVGKLEFLKLIVSMRTQNLIHFYSALEKSLRNSPNIRRNNRNLMTLTHTGVDDGNSLSRLPVRFPGLIEIIIDRPTGFF